MGYEYRTNGEISIEPPLTWGEISKSPYSDPDRRGLRLEIDEERVDTPDGVLMRRTAELVAASDVYRGDLAADLTKLIQHFPGHTFDGWIDCYGEEPGDIQRVGVVNGQVVCQVARIVWPGGPGYDQQ